MKKAAILPIIFFGIVIYVTMTSFKVNNSSDSYLDMSSYSGKDLFQKFLLSDYNLTNEQNEIILEHFSDKNDYYHNFKIDIMVNNKYIIQETLLKYDNELKLVYNNLNFKRPDLPAEGGVVWIRPQDIPPPPPTKPESDLPPAEINPDDPDNLLSSSFTNIMSLEEKVNVIYNSL
ncbi:hypothetical protein [Winogradskyella sp.]|uniref:hypothetical protein n=1 Tax=Winogradskyella sp. TaxID=1883156 RepID=UPI002628AB90|nr:hypothetical protein [Winogradskyella sp.]